jgi:hypothetical protein
MRNKGKGVRGGGKSCERVEGEGERRGAIGVKGSRGKGGGRGRGFYIMTCIC